MSLGSSLVEEKTEFTFEQLSESAKDRAREQYKGDEYPWGNWWEPVYEDFVEIASRLGFAIDKEHIQFSGFWSQGDGASFTGRYACDGPHSAAIKEYMAADEVLQALAGRLDALQVAAQLRYERKWSATVASDLSRYCHSGGMSAGNAMLGDLCFDDDDVEPSWGPDFEHAETEIRNVARALADWLYRALEKEYEYLCSNEHLDEILGNGDDLYDEDGDTIDPTPT